MPLSLGLFMWLFVLTINCITDQPQKDESARWIFILQDYGMEAHTT